MEQSSAIFTIVALLLLPSLFLPFFREGNFKNRNFTLSASVCVGREERKR